MSIRKPLRLMLATLVTMSPLAFAAGKKKPSPGKVICEETLFKGADSANRFDQNLLREVLTNTPATQNTLLVAPALHAALSMVANAASGSAQSEILSALGYGADALATLNASNSQMMKHLNRSETGLTSSLASHLFTDKAFHVLESFKATLLQSGGTTSSHAFHDDAEGTAKAINGWAAKSTKNLITNIIDPDGVSSLESLLASAFYFKGTWKYQFNKKLTYDDDFQTGSGEHKRVPMMHQTIPEIRAIRTKDYLVARIPYVGDSAAMYIAFPNLDWTTGKPTMSADQALQEALKNGDLEKFASRDPSVMVSKDEELILPKFKIKYSNKKLKDVLERMGVHGIFKGGGLGNMSDDPRLFVAYVRLDSLLEVNEEGSEAAGVASVGMALESVRTNPFEFNRAFGVVIRDDKAGLNMVTGVIQDPSI